MSGDGLSVTALNILLRKQMYVKETMLNITIKKFLPGSAER
jgi:hypothetical protein